MRIIILLLMIVSATTNAWAQAQIIGIFPEPYQGHPVYQLVVPNGSSGDYDYFSGALPNVGSAPYPVIVFYNGYSVVSAPPSVNPPDGAWANYVGNSSGLYPDYSLPIWARYRPCFTPTGDCNILVMGTGPLWHLSSAGNVHEKLPEQSNVDWALRNGYAVVIYFGRFYAGRETAASLVGLRNVFRSLKNMPGLIDPNRIGFAGRSNGGQMAIQSLVEWSFDSEQINIAAAVAEAPWVDARRTLNHYDELIHVQPREVWEQNQNFIAPYFNRLAMTFGPNPDNWNESDYRNIADRYNTPVMILGSSDDGMCPVIEATSLHDELQARGKTSYLYKFENGPPPLETMHAWQIGHGKMDQGHAVQTHILARYMFIRHMPPNTTVVMQHPSEVDLVGMIREMVNHYFNPSATQAERDNLLRLGYDLAGNGRIWYQSSDPRIPSGPAPQVIQYVINYVVANP